MSYKNLENNITIGETSGNTHIIYGATKLGDVDGGNYVQVHSDGNVVLNGSATTFRDELGDVTNLKVQGVGITSNASENSITFLTSADLNDYVYANYQINHDWKHGSLVHPHIHGEQTENNSPNLLIQYRWQMNGETKTTTWTNYVVNTPAFTYTGGTLNQIWYNGGITPPAGAGLSDILQLRILRDNDNDSGEFVGTDPYTTNVNVTSADIHIEVDGFGSNQEYVK